mmetsp:Transcript_10206/g.8953  ORF Transcript_10206/g.8953 Transcript_10206/m.8953 type:complete len:116 (-) Transcript_10206:805-1152(-)
MNRVAFMYSGWMEEGNFMEWPIIEDCRDGSGFDPRFRPWFANAATGPKDIIILIDTSGSMSSQGKMKLAINAAKKVLGTLTEHDYFGIIDFNASASSWNTDLKPAININTTSALS